MAQVSISVRTDESIVKRLDALVPVMKDQDELRAIHAEVQRADVIRHALWEGLKVLEERYGDSEKPPAAKPRKRK